MATDGDGDGDWQQGYKRQCIVEGKERWVTQNLPGLCVILATGECVLVAASPNQQYCLNCATFPAYIGLGTSFEPSGRLNLWYCSSLSSAQDLASCILQDNAVRARWRHLQLLQTWPKARLLGVSRATIGVPVDSSCNFLDVQR